MKNICSGYFTTQNKLLFFDKYGLLSNVYGISTVSVKAGFSCGKDDERCYTQLIIQNSELLNDRDVINQVIFSKILHLYNYYIAELFGSLHQ